VIRLSLLGQISLVADNDRQLRRVLAGDRRIGLLAYLALAMPGTRRRDTILAMFWPESAHEEARHRLRQLLYILRTELGDGLLLPTGREQIGLNPDRFWCDAVAFTASYKQGDMESCLQLYNGPLCEGLFISGGAAFERWLDETRERLHGKAVDAAWRLAKLNQLRGDFAAACHWGIEALRLEPDEDHLRWVLELFEQHGDRVHALRVYERFVHVLTRDFEIELSPETISLIERIRKSPRAPMKTRPIAGAPA
jgi:DNA-binding SARP family transcriptional activator